MFPTSSKPVGKTIDDLHIQNIVSTFVTNCKLNLKDIALRARNTEYNRKRFAAVVMRIKSPRTTALIFSSGKVVVTGAKSEDASRLASRRFARIIQKLGFHVSFSEFKVQNIVSSIDFGTKLSLELVKVIYPDMCVYEPELFPGLTFVLNSGAKNKSEKCRTVCLLFHSGKCVVTGIRLESQRHEAFETIYHVVKKSTSAKRC